MALKMYKGKTFVAIIPAREGSKGLPGKNIKHLNGIPLICHSILAANQSKYIDRAIVSTDGHEIAEVANNCGAEIPFRRPKELAEDNTPGVDVVLHALNSIENYDYYVLLQPTSPLRSSNDIDMAVEKCVDANAIACVSVVEAEESPFHMYFKDSGENLVSVVKNDYFYATRQELPKIFRLNGAIYVGRTDMVFEKRTLLPEDMIAYVMPKERSIDIDEDIDFSIAEAFMEGTVNKRRVSE